MSKSLKLYLLSEIFLSFGIGIVLYAQPFLYKSAGLSDGHIGELFATNSVVAGVSALLFGSIADRLGPSRVVKVATFLLSASYVLTASVFNPSIWFVTAAISGFGAALLTTTENVVLSSLTKGQERASSLSRFLAMYTFVMGVGAIVAGPLSTFTSYRTTVLIGAVFALVAPAIRFFVRVEDARASRMFRAPSKRLMGMCGYAMIFGVGLGLFNPFATLILKDNFQLGDNVIAPISATSTFMMSLGAFAVAPLLKRLRHQRTLFLSFVLSILFTVGLGLAGANAFSYVAVFLMRTVATSIPGSIVDATFLNLTDETEYAQMFGVKVFGNNVGNAMGSFAGGILLTHSWSLMIYGLSAGVLIVAYGYLQLLLAKVRKARPSHNAAHPPSSFLPG